jgi:hypothetical protein
VTDVSRRQVLAAVGAVGAAAAVGTGVTVAMLRDAEALPPAVVESGDVRFVDCATGERPDFDSLSPSLSFTEANGFSDETTLGPFGGETVPAWLVVRVCPPTETVDGEPIDAYLSGTVSVGGTVDGETAAFGELLSTGLDAADMGNCGDQVTVTVAGALDAAALDTDGLAGAASGLSLDLQVEAYLVQQTGVSEGDARSVFAATFGPCEGSSDGNGGNGGNDGNGGNGGNDGNGGNGGNDGNGGNNGNNGNNANGGNNGNGGGPE